jgi:hypothetical protein
MPSLPKIYYWASMVMARVARLLLQIPKVCLMAGPRRKRKTKRPTLPSCLMQKHHGNMIPGCSFLMINSPHRSAACRAEHLASSHPLGESHSLTLMLQHLEHPSTSHAPPRPRIHIPALPRNLFDRVRRAICHPPQPTAAREVHQAKHGVCTAREVSVQWAETCGAPALRKMG